MAEHRPIVGIDVEHDRDDGMAMQIIRDLCAAYPGHSWFVVIRGGILHIKDMDLHPDWGMCIHYTDVKADAADRKKQVLRAAGEFLERATRKLGRVQFDGLKAKVRTTL